jgi:NAD(P)-dependent dehydrogenase (short-subunit alcohol dehydrogenase family)
MSNTNINPVKVKNIIVTGAAQGIGRAIARHLAQLGHRLFLIDIDEAELCHTAGNHIPHAISTRRPEFSLKKDDLKPGYKSCNLRDTAAVRETIKAAAQHLGGRIDVLVNNAGIARPHWTGGRTMEDLPVLDEWMAYIETNLTGAFVVSQAVLPFMKVTKTVGDEGGRGEGGLSQEGSEGKRKLEDEEEGKEGDSVAGVGLGTGSACIINISSLHALQTDPNCEGYAASKAGLLGLTHAMAISGAQWGIRCNAILPGLIERGNENKKADEVGKMWGENIDEARHHRHPAGRVGSGEDIARTVEWLMDAGFVTGQQIGVDGGVTKAKYPV